MTDNPTGPELFREAAQHRDTFLAMQANTAALLTLTGTIATATGTNHHDLDAWRMVLPPEAPWTTVTFEVDGGTVRNGEEGETWEAQYRVPQHVADDPKLTEEMAEQYSFPRHVRLACKPKPKHELLPVGTRVLVSERKYADEDYPEQPYVGRIAGYDMHRSKYQINPESYGEPGVYRDYVKWAFADNRVERHPEQNPTPPAPEPKPLVLYVQRFTGKQGRVLEMGSEKGKVRVKVQWFAPGAEPVWIDLDVLKIIPAEEVDRCPNGQTGDECGSGENQCVACLRDEDDEADTIEESMGLR